MGDEGLPVVARHTVPDELAAALKSATDYAAASKSTATRRAYRSDWLDFTSWCESIGAVPLPAEPAVLASYLAQLADCGKKVSTIRRRVSAIAHAHRLKGEAAPSDAEPVRAVLAGIRRKIGIAVARKAPVTAQALQKMIRVPARPSGQPQTAVSDLRPLRDRALLLLGFAAALRRSELVALDVADLEFLERGVIVHVRTSKTDQDGAGAEIAVPNGTKLKPVAALCAWLEAAAITEGPVFRPIGKGGRRIVPTRLSSHAVATIIKRHAAAAGFDGAIYSGHSMRAGLVTTALEHGAHPIDVARITRHRDLETLRGYDRRARLFKDHAAKDFL